jgi:hypothetical protein
MKAAVTDVAAGSLLVMLGGAGMLVRLGVLDWSQFPQWTAIEHWWPLLLIIVGLVTWLVDTEKSAEPSQSKRSLEMPYGK